MGIHKGNNNKYTHSPDTAEQTAFEYLARTQEHIHNYLKLSPIRLAKYVLLVLIFHFVLVLLLWWAGIIRSVLPERQLKIELSDSSNQFIEVFFVENQERSSTLTPMPVRSDGPVEFTTPLQSATESIHSFTVPKAEINDESQQNKSDSLETPASLEQVKTDIKTAIKTVPKTDITPPQTQKKLKSEETKPLIQIQDVSASLTPDKIGMESVQSGASSTTNSTLQASARSISSPKPRYPTEAIKRRQEGRVILNLEILENGAIGQAVLVKSSGMEILDQSALEAVSAWQYTAAIKDGQLVRQWVRVVIGFELKNR